MAAAASSGNGSQRRPTVTPTHPFLPEFKQFSTTVVSILNLAVIFLAALSITKRLDKTLAYVVAGLGCQSVLVIMLIYPIIERMPSYTDRNPNSYMLMRLAKAYASFTAIECCCIAYFAMCHLDTLTWSICSAVFILLGLGLYELHITVFAPRIVTYLRNRGK